jgi:hypothetical protein
VAWRCLLHSGRQVAPTCRDALAHRAEVHAQIGVQEPAVGFATAPWCGRGFCDLSADSSPPVTCRIWSVVNPSEPPCSRCRTLPMCDRGAEAGNATRPSATRHLREFVGVTEMALRCGWQIARDERRAKSNLR